MKNVISLGEALKIVEKFPSLHAKSKYLIRQRRVFLKVENLQVWFLCKINNTEVFIVEKPFFLKLY